jgi:peptidoglycan/LPS O-acetylase OafA/YrhL
MTTRESAPVREGQEAGFFVPARTRSDDETMLAWAGLSTFLLVLAVVTRRISADGTTLTTAQAARWVAPIPIAAIAAGIAGGLFVRSRDRWREVLLGGLGFGWLISFLVFDVWFNSLAAPPDCTASQPCDISYGMGAALFAVPQADFLALGAVLGERSSSSCALPPPGAGSAAVARDEWCRGRELGGGITRGRPSMRSRS